MSEDNFSIEIADESPANKTISDHQTKYLTKLSFIPQIYTNSNIDVPITTPYREELVEFDQHGVKISEGWLEIGGRCKLRPYDDDVLVALFKLTEKKGTFDDIDMDDVTSQNIYDLVNKCRKITFHLDELLEIMGLEKHNNNRLNLVESFKNQKAINISIETQGISGGKDKSLDKAKGYGLISNYNFDTHNLVTEGYVVLDDILVEAFLLGDFFILDLNEYMKIQRGRMRKFFRFLHGIFKNKSRLEISLDEILFKILSYPNTDERHYVKAKCDFKRIAQDMEQRMILEPGFSLKKKERSYELFVQKNNEIIVELRKGPYFENREKNPLPTINTQEKAKIVRKLAQFSLSKQYELLYIHACNGDLISPITEKANTKKNRQPRTLSVHPEGGILITYLEEGLYQDQHISLNWEILETFVDFVDLFFEHHEDRGSFNSKAQLLRSVVEEGRFFTFDELNRLNKLKKEKAKKHQAAKTELEKKKIEEIQLIENNQAQIEREKNEELMNKEFNSLYEKYKMNLHDQMELISIIRKVVRKDKEFKTWFEKATYVQVTDDMIYIIGASPMASDWIRTKFIEGIQHYKNNVDVFSIPEFVEYFSISKDNLRKAKTKMDAPLVPNNIEEENSGAINEEIGLTLSAESEANMLSSSDMSEIKIIHKMLQNLNDTTNLRRLLLTQGCNKQDVIRILNSIESEFSKLEASYFLAVNENKQHIYEAVDIIVG
jgi:hypothetical protein